MEKVMMMRKFFRTTKFIFTSNPKQMGTSLKRVASQDVTLAQLNKGQEIHEFIQNVS